MSEQGRATGAFRGLGRGLAVTGLLVEAVGLAKDDPDLQTAGRKVRQAGAEVPELQREAATALPGLGKDLGARLGAGLFDLLTREEDP